MKKDFKYKYCYKITLTQGSLKDHFYFGQHQTNNLDDGYKGRGRKVIDYYKKYPNDFKKEIVGFCNTTEELNKLEYDLIHPYLNDPMCLNLIDGGRVNTMSEECRNKISTSHKGKQTWMKGKKHTDATKQRISNIIKEMYENDEIRKNPWLKYRTPHPETGEKISEALYKYYSEHTVSEETRQKLSLVHKGIPVKEEVKQKISNTLKGRHISDDIKEKISNTMKGKLKSEETKKRMSAAQKGKKSWLKGKHKVWDNKELNIFHWE